MDSLWLPSSKMVGPPPQCSVFRRHTQDFRGTGQPPRMVLPSLVRMLRGSPMAPWSISSLAFT